MEALLCEYEQVTNKASNEKDVEAIRLEQEDKNSNSNKNIDAVSTEDANNVSSETLQALHTKDDTKYTRSEIMMQEEFGEASSEFDIYNPKQSRKDGFSP